jgi:RNA polymerase sigma-70 factor (ECF subfamily)
MDYRVLSEPDLVARLQGGDNRAGDELYQRYHASVERYCHCLMHDYESARDAANDTFLKVVSRIHTLRDAISFRAWLFSIARNNCLMTARKMFRELRLEDAPEVWEEHTPLTRILDGELHQIVHEAIDALRPIYREALILREFESLSYREIADATQCSVASVKFRLHKARHALAVSLGTYLDEGDSHDM